MSEIGHSFAQLLLACIDEGLSVLGTEPRLAVYQYLSTICSLQREEIPDKIEEFAAGIRKALGGASRVMERIILRKLFQRIGSSFKETPDLGFAEYVAEARRRFDLASRKARYPTDPLDAMRSKKGQVSG